LFQFEHKAQGALNDPIAAIGSSNTDRGDELGTLVAIDLVYPVNNRYLGFSSVAEIDTGLYLHAMAAYQESLLRILSNNPISIPGTISDYANNLPQLPTTNGNTGTSGNDLMFSNITSTTHAGDGNDIIVVEVKNSSAIDGGAGNDAYIIKSFGAQITINSSAVEKADNLYIMGSHLNLSADYGDQGLCCTTQSRLSFP
jgi:hypothetical protein